MPETFLNRMASGLLPGRNRSRILKELEQHIEDSGGSADRLGRPEDVAALYNAIYPVWPRFLIFSCLVFVTSILLFCGGYLIRIDETSMESQLMYSPLGIVVGLLGVAGMFLMIPGIYISAAIFFPSQNFDAHFFAVPIIANVVWMIVYAVMLLPPPGQMVRLFARRLKS